MRLTLLVFSLILVIVSCSQKEKELGNKFIINGEINDTTETQILLQQRIDREFVSIDSAMLIDGKFSFKGTVDVAEEYYLKKGDRDMLMFFLEDTVYSVVADSVLISEAHITGGETQNLFNVYNDEYQEMYAHMMDIYQASHNETDLALKEKMMREVDSLYENTNKFQETFMLDHLNSPVAVYLLSRVQYGKDAIELSALLNQIDSSLNKMVSYQALSERVANLEKVAIGETAPDFTQNDADGNPITFSDVYAQNSYTLIDFWASWCGPCRGENPNVVAAYKKYNEKGFNVFGVSLDQSKEKWLEAVEKDELTWQHVSDLQGWNNEFAREYAVNSIPANFLVDINGIIVAANLREEALHQKLAELLDK